MAKKINKRVITAGKIVDPPGSQLAVARRISNVTPTAAGPTASMGSAGMLGGGPAGAPLPSVLATGSPLSVFQYTLSRADRLALYRYFARQDCFVGRAIELHAELPMSRITIAPPKGPSNKQNKEINRIYENMSDRLKILSHLLDVAREYWLQGDVYIWHEWNEKIYEWDQIYILPVEYCHSVVHPFMRDKEIVIFARPLVDTASIRRMTDRDLYMVAGDPDVDRLYDELEDELPADVKTLLDYGEGTPLPTDPSKGSYVYHLSRNRPPNEAYGQGIIERCLEPLLRLENLKNAQLQISGRNMQPKHLVWAENLSVTELGDLRAQIDLALLDNVDYPIVTNYPVTWQVINANERLLQVDTEYNTLREDLATGLGTTKDLLTGQATYSGQRVTMEVMNTQYLMFREVMRDYVENGIFKPVAEAQAHYHYEEIDTWIKVKPSELEAGDDVIQEYDGTLRKRKIRTNKVYNHSKVRFNRLSIRDNAEVYDQLFQLHQKGSLALKYLLDIHNIDPEENAAALLEDIGTVRDPTFNRLLENLYTNIADPLIERTNIVDRVIKALNLDVISQGNGEPSPGQDITSGGGMPSVATDIDTGLSEGDLGDASLDEVEQALPGNPATVPATASRRKSKKKKAAPLPGIPLTAVQVESIIKASTEQKLSRREVLKITGSPHGQVSIQRKPRSSKFPKEKGIGKAQSVVG